METEDRIYLWDFDAAEGVAGPLGGEFAKARESYGVNPGNVCWGLKPLPGATYRVVTDDQGVQFILAMKLRNKTQRVEPEVLRKARAA